MGSRRRTARGGIGFALALFFLPGAGLAQEAAPKGPGRAIGDPGTDQLIVAPAPLLGDAALRREARAGPLSGSVRLGSIATPEGAVFLTGSFASGHLAKVTASRGRARIDPTVVPAALATRLDDWRPNQPTPLSTSGPSRACGLETATLEVRSAKAMPGVGQGTYVAVSWVCRFATVERWLFKVPPAEKAPPPENAPRAEKPSRAAAPRA